LNRRVQKGLLWFTGSGTVESFLVWQSRVKSD